MLVFSLARTALTTISSARDASPTTMPSYTTSPGPTNSSPAQLQVVEGVAGGVAQAVGDHGAAHAVGQLAGPRHPAGVVLVEQGRAAGGGEQQRAEPDEPACRRLERDDRAAGVARAQVDDPPLAGRERLGDGADVLVGHVAHAPLERLVAAGRRSPW